MFDKKTKIPTAICKELDAVKATSVLLNKMDSYLKRTLFNDLNFSMNHAKSICV